MADDPLLTPVRHLWAELACTPVEFGASHAVTTVVAPGSLLCPPGWVGIVRIGDAAVVTAPDARAAALLESAARRLSYRGLVDAARLRDELPVVDVLGPASLSYVDRDGFLAAHRGVGVERVPVGDRDVAALLTAAGEEDADESGLAEISSAAFVLRRGDEVVAAAGYRTWPRATAHLSVLVAPSRRGRRLGRTVASAATAHALEAGLVPQWRARPLSSRRVAVGLGYRELGAQVSIRLGEVPSGGGG
ncbi:GNAT family N-acetyltransferase [Embleya sp. MST-111070]|uniref:GNAT family N-acetyltransferase n=1 Tax=Embleya sp. MST-111070 TaxID=3398231 RepID=UPI003F73F816